MARIEAYILMLFTIFVGHVKSSICYHNGYMERIYCSNDCCGSSGYQYCCNSYRQSTISYSPSTVRYSTSYIQSSTSYSPSTEYTGYVGPIVLVVGSLAGLGILIGIVVCCCCCRCTGGTSGQVLQPHMNPAFSVTTLTTPTNGMQVPMTHLSPGMYAQSYPKFPQMAGGYSPGNASLNNPYGATLPINNPYGAPPSAPPPSYDNVVGK